MSKLQDLMTIIIIILLQVLMIIIIIIFVFVFIPPGGTLYLYPNDELVFFNNN